MKRTTYSLLFASIFTLFALQAKAQMGNALNFDGTDDYVSVNNDAELQIPVAGGTCTLEAWIAAKPAALNGGYRGIIVKQQAYGLFLNDGVLTTYDWGGGAEKSTTSFVADGNWHHVAMTFTSGAVNGTKFYVDGNLVMTTTMTTMTTMTILNPALHPLAIGSGSYNGGSQCFNGDIDEARVWNIVRTKAEIQAAMNVELMGNELGLVSYYKFNQGIPTGNNPTETTLIDANTTSANTGTLNNFALTVGKVSNWIAFNTPLAVELLSFKGTPQYESVKLAWTIDRSVNNKGFQIERLKSASGAWEVLDFVADDAKKTAYEYVDNTSLIDQNVLYYRLRMIDNDGDEQLSKVVAVSTKGAKGLKVYPSIVTDGFLNLEITGKPAYTDLSRDSREGSSDYAIYNVYGQSVLNGKIGQQIDVSALTRGTYIVTVGTEKAKFIKQ
jgi:hypothetical protein